MDFAPVPTFGGIFNGNNHTISGITFDAKGSYVGIFRYIRETGKVSDLNVRGNITPGGSKSYAGGIAGENLGTSENCSFDGTVKGENIIGGIVGNNTDSGRIVSSAVFGNIIGENSTGGIVCKNNGYISDCTNNAAVNTVYEEKKSSLSDIDADTGSIIESRKNDEEENKEESILGHTDTGGIAGFSSGVIQGCINNAYVGYKHIDYNVGGISGRQSGYMLGCKNYGFIQGRKDVGGIVGKSESTLRKNYSKSKVSGKRYIGGIAGKGETVTSSYSLSNINGGENIGAVCGTTENRDNVCGNFFTDNGLGAIDGISYKKKQNPYHLTNLKTCIIFPQDS